MRQVGLLLALILSGLGAGGARAQGEVYERDFDFVCETVAKESAAIVRHRIDWKAVEKRYRPRLAGLTSDADHIALMNELLAECHDSHTGLLRYDIGDAKIPSKWDGLWSAGLWIVEDEGRFHLAGRDGKGAIDPGACLATIGDWPAHLAMEREMRRCARIIGISSEHSFFASIGNRFVPMGEAQSIELGFMAGGKLRTEGVRRWGPSGRGFDSFAVTAPPDLKRAAGAVALVLPEKGPSKIGYVRITGSMDRATVEVFHAAFEALREADAVVLDCRGMGGGSDDCAWEIAGRFFAKGVDNGRNGRIEPSGAWQFEGPVVMIQDSLEVSSAETFTWAMSETGRAISVGRPTGGWSIIPRRFSAPSGKFDFRIGVTDRATPIKGLKTEGEGWAPDLLLAWGPLTSARPGLALEVAVLMAQACVEEFDVEKTRHLFAKLGAGRVGEVGPDATRLARQHPLVTRVFKLIEDDLLSTIDLERSLLAEVVPPDCLGCARRLERLRDRARSSGARRSLRALEKELKGLGKEAKAQEALLQTLDRDFSWSARDREAFLARHGKTRYGRFASDHLPARD